MITKSSKAQLQYRYIYQFSLSKLSYHIEELISRVYKVYCRSQALTVAAYFISLYIYIQTSIRVQMISKNCLKGQCHEIFDFWFFHESISPKHRSIPLGPFRIFSKIRGDIRSSRFADTGGKCKKSSSIKVLII